MGIYEDLLSEEGLRTKPYRDTAGKMTIGIGRNLDDTGITREEAHILFKNDLSECITDLKNIFINFDRYTSYQQDALINMRFNLGFYKFREFKRMIKAVEAYDWKLAAKECLNSKAAKQLPARYYRIAKKMIGENENER